MKALFSPFRLRAMELKNRIVLSPMQQYSAANGVPSSWHLVHLGSRAVGGAGLILTECTAVSAEGLCTLSDVGIWNKEQVEGWKPIVKFVHEQGAKIGMQLWHAGGKASTSHPEQGFKPLLKEDGGWVPKSASATPINLHQPQAMTVAEIQQTKIDFVKAALNAIEAGFDTIELHAAHGYLFHQFYSALTNKRTDAYGGSFENRIRFLIETIREIRSAVPQDYPLMLRLSAVDYDDSENGWQLEDTLRLLPYLEEYGIDFITASGGGFVQVNQAIVRPNYQLPFAIAIKQASGMPAGAVGMITDGEQANEIIEKQEADLVVIAREHLRNPYFGINAAIELGETVDLPWQYKRAF